MTPAIHNLLANHAQHRGDDAALIFAGREYSFAELHRESCRLANALRDYGLQPGDKFATVLPNCLQLVLAFFAAAAGGFVIVPCSTLLRPTGLQTLLCDSHAKLVIADASQADALTAIRKQLPGIQKNGYVLTEADAAGFITFAEFVDAASDAPPRPPRITGNTPYNIMYSSGTTGAPKGIVHSHFARAMYCTLFANEWRITRESIVLHAGALVFNGAMLTFMPWWYLGCRLVLHGAFNAEQFIAEVAARKVTHAMLVPAQIIAILDSPDFAADKLASLQMLASVGAPLHLQCKRKINEVLPGRFYELYGVTEGFMTVLDRADAPRKIESVGRGAAFTEVCILDAEDSPCAPGVIGEICGRGPLLMNGYYNRPDATAEAMRGGWLHSGDLGYMDEEGFVFLVDRKKDMIVSGGVNVYPKDIEEVVMRHAAVREAAVFGTPHAKWGEAPVAAVRVNREVDAAEVMAWVNARVDAKYQRLVGVAVVDEFPRNVAGKVLKRELREGYAGGCV